MKARKRISIVSTLHYIRLVYRSVLFIMLLFSYLRCRLDSGEAVTERVESTAVIPYIPCAVFAVEMIMRFFPSK